MDLKHLKAFLTVADTGNVTRAAELLHVVQPAVSRQIRLLEDDLGVTLFQRERHGMSLTEAGRALVDYARRALLELDRARVELQGREGGVSGLVTLGLLPSTTDVLSSPLVRAVLDEYPGIRIRIAMGYADTLRRWLESGEVDAALLYGAQHSADIHTTPLMDEALWVIGPPDSGLRPQAPVSLATLADSTMVLPSAPHGIRLLVEQACAAAGVSLRLAAETNALSVQRSLVLGGLGMTILPPIAVVGDLRHQTLVGAPVAAPGITRTIVLALPANRATGRHVRCVVDLLVQQMRQAVERGIWPEGRWLMD